MKNKHSDTLLTNPPAFLSEAQLVLVTGLSARSIRNYVKAGIIPRIKIGGRVLFRWADVDAALAKLSSFGPAPH
jgi:predicted DNA-binding transcriptional regulator AlpA